MDVPPSVDGVVYGDGKSATPPAGCGYAGDRVGFELPRRFLDDPTAYNRRMVEAKKCFFCTGDCTDAAAEHVISEALGCKEVIRAGVCTDCNHRFGHSFEADFVNSLALFRNFFKIPNAEGVVPGVVVKGKIGSEEFKFVITGDGKAEIPPHLLGSEKTATGQEREFRIFQKKHETKIEESLRSKHGDLVWKHLESRDGLQIIDVQANFESHLLCSAEANRTIAKYALNLLVHEYGYESVEGRFGSLIDYIKGEPSNTRAGISWDKNLLEPFPFEPPKHLIMIVQDSKTRSVTIFIWLFCLFPFCVITEDPRVLVDSFRGGAIDPYKGKITPLLLEGSPAVLGKSLPPFPAPEFGFALALGRVELGTERQAARAAKRAITFMRRVIEGRPGMPHICYSCRRILKELTPVCQHCGNSPVPQKAEHSTEPLRNGP